MRKLYSIILVLMVSMVKFAANAQDDQIIINIHIDNPDRVKVLDPASSYYNKIYLEFDSDNRTSISVGKSDIYFDIEALPGFLIGSIENGEGNTLVEDASALPATDFRFYFSKYEYGEGYVFLPGISDGMDIYIKTVERPSAIYTFKGNADHIKSIKYNGDISDPDENGLWTVKVYEGKDQVYIETKEDFRLRKITENPSGNEIKLSSKTGAYVSCENLDGDKNFEIISYPIDEDRTASFTLNVKSGEPTDISLQLNGTYKDIPLSGELSQIIKFDPETETYFTLTHSDYSKDLYKVVLDEKVLDDNYGTYRFEVKDGSVLEVYAAFPEIEVPVKFTFTNKDTEGFISYIEVNDERIDDGSWLKEDFKLMMGDELYIKFNTSEYDWDSIEVNGKELYSAYFNEKISEESYNIVITASKIGTDKVTVKCDAWKHITLEGYDTIDFTLTGETTEIEIPSNESKIKVIPAEGYIVYDVYDEATGESLLDGKYFRNWSDGMTIVIDAEEFVRDQTMMIYLEDCKWNNAYFYLANNTDLEKKINLETGYNRVEFGYGDFDDALFRLNLPDYSDGVVYLNGELLDWAGFNLLGIDQVQDGDVLKVYSEEKDTHYISYNIAEDVNIAVLHDHIVPIYDPSEHDVLPGTIIHILPVAREESASIRVKVNDEEITPGEDGVYSVIADGDKAIKVEKGESTGINEIEAGTVQGDVYDTLGSLVMKNASASEIKTLPAGIYIIGKRKIVVK